MGIDYLTLFPMGPSMNGAMRANLFAFPNGNEEWVREFVQRPGDGLRRCFPELQSAIGEYEITGAVETSLINLYKTDALSTASVPDGVVLIGDAGQNACPSTGSGVSKVFTDVQVLAERAQRWLASAGMSSAKLREFYDDSRKRAMDAESLAAAVYRRMARTDKSLRWKIHRARIALSMRLGRPGETASQQM